VKSRTDPGRKDVRHIGMNHLELLQLISSRKTSPKAKRILVDEDSTTVPSVSKRDEDKMSKKLDRAALYDDWELQLQKRSLKFESSIRDSESAHIHHAHRAAVSPGRNNISSTSSAVSMKDDSSIKTVSALSSNSSAIPTSPKPSYATTTPLHKRVKQKSKKADAISSCGDSPSRTSNNDFIAVRNPETIEDGILPTVEEDKTSEKLHLPTAPPTVYFVSSIGAVSCRKNVDPHAHEHSIPYFTSEARAAKKRSDIAQVRTDRGFTSAIPKQIVNEMYDKLQGEELHAVTKNSERQQPLAVRAISTRKAIEEDVQTFNEIVVKVCFVQLTYAKFLLFIDVNYYR
jgi:hypothetical protein